MTDKPGMLPGDQFSFDEWKADRDKDSSAPEAVPGTVQIVIDQLAEMCRIHGIPFVVGLSLRNGSMMFSDLGDKPQNVTHDVLLARSAIVDNPSHKLSLMSFSLQSFDFSKIKFP